MMEQKSYNCLGHPGTLISDEHAQFIIEFLGEKYGSLSVNLGAEELFCGLCVSTFVPLSGQEKLVRDHGEKSVTLTGINRREGYLQEIPLAELWLLTESDAVTA